MVRDTLYILMQNNVAWAWWVLFNLVAKRDKHRIWPIARLGYEDTKANTSTAGNEC
jgi:hypothetical protein